MRRIATWLVRVLRLVLLLAALALLTATLLPFSTSDAWWVRYPEFAALQVGVAAVLVGIGLVSLWRHPVAGMVTAGLLGGVAVQLGRVSPFLAPSLVDWPAPTVAGGSCDGGDRLRVLEVNVQRTNRHDHALLDMVRQADPDIAWFQEVDAWWEGELSALGNRMPHGVQDVQANYFGVHLFSKPALTDAGTQELTHSNNPSAFATATLPSGRAVRLYAIHPRPPQIGQSTAERDAQLMATALAARSDPMPHVLLGDLNSVPWTGTLDRLEQVGRFADPRVGRGLFITWNAKRILAKWPLDHILAGPGVTLAGLRVLPAFGSDHRPLLADLCIDAPPGPPAPLDPTTASAAQATVARGQGKALGPGATRPVGAETEKED